MPDTRHTQSLCGDVFLRRSVHDLRACFRAGGTVPDWIMEDLEATFETVPESVVEQLDMLRVQAARGDRLVVDISAYVMAGRAVSVPEEVACDELLDRAARMVPQTWEVTVDCDCASVTTDGEALERALGAVVDNAVTHHHAPPGALWLTARDAGEAVLISVEDDGPGIPAEHCDRVFEPLTTLRSRDECEGSGLGLAIARQLVSGVGGRILAEARDGARGARLTITLPGF